MPRRKTVFIKGNYYHIYNRGNNGNRIFFSSDHYLHCLKLLKRYAQKYQITIIAYCLMPNHYHLLVRQDSETAVSHFISVLFNAYVQAVNRGNGRSGSLFGERDGKLIDQEFVKTYFTNTQEYIDFVMDYLNGDSRLPEDIQKYLFE